MIPYIPPTSVRKMVLSCALSMGGTPLLLRKENHLTTHLLSAEKPTLSATLIPTQGDREHYHTLFQKALKAIEEHRLEKVVFSL